MVVGKIRKKNQDSNYSGPDNNKIFVPFASMARDLPRPDSPPGTLSDIIVAPKDWVVDLLPATLDERTGRIEDIDWPLERSVRAIMARHHGFDPADKQAIAMWDTSLETLMFGRMIANMKQFFTIVGIVTLALGAIAVMNIMLVAVKERTREIGVRKALGATTRTIQRQFFLDGFFLTILTGSAGMGLALGISWGIISVVVLLAYGDGFRGALDAGFRGAFSDGTVIVWPGQTSMQVGGERAGKRVRVTADDVLALAELPLVKNVSPEFMQEFPTVVSNKQSSHLVRG